MSVHVFGIRHHGPGCARSLREALEALRPDVVLLEGPADAAEALPLVARDEMRPPVALLLYPPEAPRRAVYYPLAVFSPEWQALRYAAGYGVGVRLMDLPRAHMLALEDKEAPGEGLDSGRLRGPAGAEDPTAALAAAAGYDDPELWWERQIEQRRNAAGLFEGILEAMAALRADGSPLDGMEARREAFMRQTIRAAVKEGFKRIAVVCGAWHAPVLAELGSSKEDQAVLKGLPRAKVVATWIPWTYSRLAFRSGYGAGVTSPGWYHHLWTSADQTSVRWAAHAARLLRREGLDAPPAGVIEVVRLADAVAALRGLPMPGLAELNDAVGTVFCRGDSGPMRMIRRGLEMADRLGAVPADTPATPIQRDLEAWQRRLRLRPSPEIQTLDLDLRKEKERERSRLLHRLRLLNVPWGEPGHVGTKAAGTFHEVWQLRWQVEFAVGLVEASVWGNTVEQAAAGAVRERAAGADDLPALTGLLDAATRAGLAQATASVLDRLQARAAVAVDVRHLMDALPALAQVARYGDVRGTPDEQVLPVFEGLFERVLISLPGACPSLDDDAAAQMVESIGRVRQSVDLLETEERRGRWREVLRRLLDSDPVHGLVRGWCCRLLLEQRALQEGELERRVRLALAPAAGTAPAAAWVEGLLRGSGLVLLHEDGLWAPLDAWLSGLPAETFTELLPLLRRAFAGFPAPERRAMGERVKRLGGGRPAADGAEAGKAINRGRAELVLPVLAHVLGVPLERPGGGVGDGRR